MNQIPIENIESAVQQNGSVVSYAVLHSLYSSTEKSENPINDVLDCYIPIVKHACRKQTGKQLNLSLLKDDIKNIFQIEIPVYTLEHLIPTLEKAKIIEYKKIAKIHIVNKQKEESSTINITTAIEEIDAGMASLSQAMKYDRALISDSWSSALINFLKVSNDNFEVPSKKIDDKIVSDPIQIERFAVAEMIRHLHDMKNDLYDSIVNVFVGVLIENFVSSLNSFGDIDEIDNLTVFYDTTILLRLLGTSGKLLKNATVEFHRYIGDLGISSEFFNNNEEEVSNIIGALIAQKEYGSEIYGETGDAIARGEVDISYLRTVEQVFVERLAEMSVFPSKYEQSGFQKNVVGQIDEGKFESGLIAESTRRMRRYSEESAKNDAISLGHVIRMRRGRIVRELSECPGIFVTNNRLLASYSKKFALEEGQLRNFEIPPVLHVSQACTIFWLAKDRELTEKNASGELLANCYEALRPDSEFYKTLFTKIEEYKKLQDVSPSVMTTLKRIAKQDTFGRSAMLENQSAADLLARAEEAVRKSDEQKELEYAEQSKKVGESKYEEGKDYAEREREKRIERRSNRISSFIVKLLEITIISIFLLSVIYSYMYSSGTFTNISTIVVAILTILSALDLFGVKLISKIFDRIRRWISEFFYRIQMKI